jgi:hypothetical protein
MNNNPVAQWLASVRWRRELPPAPPGYEIVATTADKARFFERLGGEEFAHHGQCEYATLRPARADYHPPGLLALGEAWLASHGSLARAILFGGHHRAGNTDAARLALYGYRDVGFGYQRIADACKQLGAPLPFEPKALYQVQGFLDAAAHLAGERPAETAKPAALENRLDFSGIR